MPDSDTTTPATTTAATPAPTFAVKVVSQDGRTPSYVGQFPHMPKYFDSFQHTSASPVIYIQQVSWTPQDSDAIVCIVVG